MSDITMEKKTGKVDLKHYINILITVLFMFGFRYIPAPEPLTPYGMAILGIFIGVIYGWSTSSTGLMWVSLLAVFAVGFTDFGNVTEATVKMFSADTALLLLLGMFLAGPIQKANLGEWMVTKILTLKIIEGHPWRFVAVILFGTGIIGFLSNGFVVALVMVAILNDLYEKAGYKIGDSLPIMLTIGMFISLMSFSTIFPFKGWGLYCVSAFKGAVGTGLDYGKYVIVAICFYLILSFGYMLLMKVIRCDVSKIQNIDLSDYKKKYENGLTLYQKVAMGLFLFWVLGCMAVTFLAKVAGIGQFLTLAGVMGITLITIILYMTIKVDEKPIVTPTECNKFFMWDMVFVVATGMFLASLLTGEGTGVSAWVAQTVGPLLQGHSEFVFLLLMGILALILTNFLNNVAIMFIFMAVVGTMASQGLIQNVETAGMVVALSTIIGFYTPASSAYGAMIHGSDWCPSGLVYKYGLAVFIYLFVVLAILIFIANIVF